MGMHIRLGALLFFLVVLSSEGKYYLPGVSPNSFHNKEIVLLKANEVTSTKTQVPFDYYDLPFCKKRRTYGKSDNLGGGLSGDKSTVSPYQLKMKEDEKCIFLCRKEMKKNNIKQLQTMIDEEYRVHWLLDNLPVAVRNKDQNYVTRGYPIGFKMSVPSKAKPQHYLFNHARIIVRYSEIPDEFEGARIVGFEVSPFSVNHLGQGSDDKSKTPTLTACPNMEESELKRMDPDLFQVLTQTDKQDIIFSYDVQWQKSEKTWSTRWDTYLKGDPNDEIHFFSLVNSVVIVLFLTGVVAMIMLRALRKDIASYNEMQTLEEAQEESGWKLVHGDVFRAPPNPMLLSVLGGTGIQLLAMAFITLGCAIFGLMSPANRGTLITSVVFIYLFMGALAGYHSARTYKLLQGKDWKTSTLLTALLYPGLMGMIFIGINIFVSSQGSSSTAPPPTLLSALFLLLGVLTPLVFVGSFFGFKKDTIETPVRTNQIARHIPDQVWYSHPLFSIAVGGIFPFGAVCIELFFIMSAIWLHQLYFMFGFLFVVLFILVATCAEISIVICYFQLCSEDFNWWWRSFISAGSSGGYMFLYSIWYFYSKLSITSFVPSVLYFSYMAMCSMTFAIITGSIGFYASLWFIRQIYGAIKID